MILGRQEAYSETSIGTQFLIGEVVRPSSLDRPEWMADRYLRATHLYTVEEVGDRRLYARDQNGDRREFEITNRGEFTGPAFLELMWQGRLPNAPFDEIARFADALLSERVRSHPFAFLVTAVSEEAASGRLVTFASRPLFTDMGETALAGQIVGNAFISEEFHFERADHQWEVGSFVIANGVDVRHLGKGSLLIRVGRITVIRSQSSAEDIGSWLPVIDDDPSSHYPGTDRTKLGSGYEFNHECERGIARSEPNRALFYWFAQDPAKPADTECHVLGSEGITFHGVDAIADHFYNVGIEEGLWVLDNASWWSFRGWEDSDCGIDGDWRPATPEDLSHFGFSAESADKELCDIREIDLNPGIAAEAIALATASAASSPDEAYPPSDPETPASSLACASADPAPANA